MASAFWNCRRTKPPSGGLQRSPKLAAARRNSASLGMTQRVDGQGPYPLRSMTLSASTFFIAMNFSQETVISGLLTGGLLAKMLPPP